MAKRVKKVDLTLIEEIASCWPTLVDPRSRDDVCHPEFVKNRRARDQCPLGRVRPTNHRSNTSRFWVVSRILDERAPTSLKTIQKA